MVPKREGRLNGGKTSSAAAQIKPQPSPAALSVTTKILCGNDGAPKKPSHSNASPDKPIPRSPPTPRPFSDDPFQPMNTPLTRRRFFAIAALTAAGATAPFLLNRNRPAPLPTTGEPVIWKGIALGSGAELRLFGVDRKEAEIYSDRKSVV